MPTDPFTGATITPGVSVVRCPRCHNYHLATSWQAAGNRCCYPGCEYTGAPRPVATATEAPLSAINVISQLTQPTNSAPLTIRVLSQSHAHHPWWPAFWVSLADAVTTLVLFTIAVAIGWSVLLSNAGVPAAVLSSYIPLDTTFLVLAVITALVSATVLALARVFGRWT